jgi:hypothetical protein
MDKVTDDQKARIVELYTSEESTVQIGRRPSGRGCRSQ